MTLYMYRAYYMNGDTKEYINGGKFYTTVGACKNGIHAHYYECDINNTLDVFIEKYNVELAGNTHKATINRKSRWSADIKFEEIVC